MFAPDLTTEIQEVRKGKFMISQGQLFGVGLALAPHIPINASKEEKIALSLSIVTEYRGSQRSHLLGSAAKVGRLKKKIKIKEIKYLGSHKSHRTSEQQFKATHQCSQMHQWEMLEDLAESLGGVEETPVPSPPLQHFLTLPSPWVFSSSLDCVFNTASYQIFIGETRDFLLKSKLHLSLRRQLQGLQESLLLFLQLFFHCIHLVFQSFYLLLVLSSLILELRFQQPEKRTTPVISAS